MSLKWACIASKSFSTAPQTQLGAGGGGVLKGMMTSVNDTLLSHTTNLYLYFRRIVPLISCESKPLEEIFILHSRVF